ncbi:MAG: BMP family ABC transporter substrate-binding protein [Armatimonadota bacterium]|nr:BMP family ABC transporter substrate-binding protein [Armatimonadota bacterium]
MSERENSQFVRILHRAFALLVALVLVAGATLWAPATAAPQKPLTLAILHFSIIKGTTWSGAHHRAAQRIAQKYPNVRYVYREEVGPDATVPYAKELIAQGANIVVGNAEFIGLPLATIADQYPNVYFASVIASDLTRKRNFIRFFPRQYQALYLEGLIAGALTRTGNIGIVSAFPNVQVMRRQAGFFLGVQDAAKVLGKKVNVYVKYVGDWYKPTEEREVAQTLVSQYKVDVITQQTDSGSPLDVAQERKIWFVGKDMDVVGFYGWSSTDTVAVSFDTRWEVLYEHMIKEYLAGNRNPKTLLYLGLRDTMTLADGAVVPTVDIMNNNKVGLDAISPKARPLIPEAILKLVAQRREQMRKGQWDPFFEHAFVSNGTGLALKDTPIPPKGTVVKKARQMPSDEWLLGKFNFDLEGMTILK